MMEKLQKSELIVALAAFLAMLLAPKLGMSEDALKEFLTMIGGTAMTYIVGRSYAKPREAAAVQPPAPPANPT